MSKRKGKKMKVQIKIPNAKKKKPTNAMKKKINKANS